MYFEIKWVKCLKFSNVIKAYFFQITSHLLPRSFFFLHYTVLVKAVGLYLDLNQNKLSKK